MKQRLKRLMAIALLILLLAGADQTKSYASSTYTLTIQKTNNYLGQPKDATYEIYRNNDRLELTQTGTGQYTQGGTLTQASSASGSVSISGLVQGSYQIVEVISPAGYQTANETWVPLNGNTTVTIENLPTELILTLKDDLTKQPLANAPVSVIDQSGNPMQFQQQSAGVYWYVESGESTVMTDSNGGLHILYMPAGHHLVRQSEMLGYAAMADIPIDFDLSVRISATKRPTMLEFTKTDSVTVELLDGGVFQLLDSGGSVVRFTENSAGVYYADASGADSFTTQNGTATLYYLPTGDYTIVEVAVPANHVLSVNQTVTVTSSNSMSNPATITMTNDPYALRFEKTDAFSGTPLDGATFSLYDGETLIKLRMIEDGVYTPDANGSATFTTLNGSALIAPLAIGTYTVSEETAPDGFAPGTDVSGSVTEESTSASPAVVAMENAPLALLVEKVDAVDKSPISNVAFRIKDTSGHYLRYTLQDDGIYHVTEEGGDSFSTDVTGIANIRYIPAGAYTLEEQQQAGFAPAESQEFIVAAENAVDYPARVGVENWPLYLSVSVSDMLDGSAIEGVGVRIVNGLDEALRFSLQADGSYKVTNAGSNSLHTNVEGEILISHIPAGRYLVAAQAHAGYALADAATVNITNTNTEETPAAVSIENNPTAVVLTTIDTETQAPLSGVVFAFQTDTGRAVALARMDDGSYRPVSAVVNTEAVAENTNSAITGADGTITIHCLPYGSYRLIQQQINGYAPLTGITFEIASEHSTHTPLEMTVENIPASLTITKTDAVTGIALPGTRFRLLDSEGATIPLVLVEDGIYRPASDNEESVSELTVGVDGTATVKYITGTITVRESGVLVGYAYAPDQTVEVGMTVISVVDGDASLAATSVDVADLPLMLTVGTVHAKTGDPIDGAAFQIIPDSAETPFTFVLLDGVYWYSEAGTITTITMDSNAQAYVCGLPAGKYRLVESVTPSGFFPAPAQDFTLQLAHTSDEPLELVVRNTPEVKLGLDSDKWDTVLLIGGGAVLLVAGAAVFYFFYRKKRKATA